MRRVPSILALFASFWLLAAPGALAAQEIEELHLRAQIQGAIKRPGLYVLPVGSRLAELVQRAGGPRADAALQGVNLARRLTDGENCYVPSRAEATRAASNGTALPDRVRTRPVSRGPSGPIDLNRASISELDALPGIGPGLAAAIVKERSRKGRFSDIEELREVQGIGRKRLERLRPHLRVD